MRNKTYIWQLHKYTFQNFLLKQKSVKNWNEIKMGCFKNHFLGEHFWYDKTKLKINCNVVIQNLHTCIQQQQHKMV